MSQIIPHPLYDPMRLIFTDQEKAIATARLDLHAFFSDIEMNVDVTSFDLGSCKSILLICSEKDNQRLLHKLGIFEKYVAGAGKGYSMSVRESMTYTSSSGDVLSMTVVRVLCAAEGIGASHDK